MDIRYDSAWLVKDLENLTITTLFNRSSFVIYGLFKTVKFILLPFAGFPWIFLRGQNHRINFRI